MRRESKKEAKRLIEIDGKFASQTGRGMGIEAVARMRRKKEVVGSSKRSYSKVKLGQKLAQQGVEVVGERGGALVEMC
jgi:hypothetical protein